MKNKKILITFLIAFVLLLLTIIGFVIWVLPRNMGPIEPFLNFGDLFIRYDGTSPGKPVYYQISPDCNTGDLAKPGELIQPDSGCDSWELNRFERPFNALSQDKYFPDLDIQDAYLGRDADWYYLRIALFDPKPDADFITGTYAIEMDLDLDGRGDLLVLVSEPGKKTGKEWSTRGVQIWRDSNNDVGGNKPRIPDGSIAADGYDTLLFDQGKGADSNGAWARAFMTGSAHVELAFKTEYLDGDIAFKWWVWSAYASNPELYDLHDYFSRKQAGAANVGNALFPVKEVFATDNSCANMWGASPDPNDPDYCFSDVKIKHPTYNTCIMLKCIIPLIPCRVPGDKPGDDPCKLPFEEWLMLIWHPAHPNEAEPSEDQLWEEYEIYALDPYCPLEDDGSPTPTDTPTYTPTSTDTPTPTPTDTPTRPPPPTPTDTPTPRPPGCNFDCGCQPDQGETEDNCPSDCPQHCGNGMCDCGETYETCKQDCKPKCSSDLPADKCKAAGGQMSSGTLRSPYCICP